VATLRDESWGFDHTRLENVASIQVA